MSKLKIGQLWIGLMCLILGIVLALQFKIVQQNVLEGLNPSVVSSNLISELTKLKSDKSKLKTQVEDLQNKIDTIENTAAQESIVVKDLKDKLDKYKIIAGAVDVEGTGVEVVVDNPSKDLNYGNELSIINEYDYILRVVNELHAGGAEAVSINGQRLLSTSEIRTAGNYMKVNKVPLTAPIVINAIGDPKDLDGSLNQRFGIVNEIRDNGYMIEVKKSDKVRVPKYDGEITLNFAEIVE
jgi:uncharacterized protein YlxW (UPF0749 family)